MVSAFHASICDGTYVVILFMNIYVPDSHLFLCFDSLLYLQLFLQILELVISRSVVKLVQQLIDEDGSVKDSAVCSHILILRVYFVALDILLSLVI